MPFFVVFEALGPVIETAGLLYCLVGVPLGWVNVALAALILALAFVYGLVLSFGALAMEGRAFSRYPDWRDLGRLMAAAVFENFGYRQWIAYVRVAALVNLVRGRNDWGVMKRAGFAAEPAPADA